MQCALWSSSGEGWPELTDVVESRVPGPLPAPLLKEEVVMGGGLLVNAYLSFRTQLKYHFTREVFLDSTCYHRTFAVSYVIIRNNFTYDDLTDT